MVNTSAAQLVAGLQGLLDLSASFNLYVAHGGTNFGFTAGERLQLVCLAIALSRRQQQATFCAVQVLWERGTRTRRSSQATTTAHQYQRQVGQGSQALAAPTSLRQVPPCLAVLCTLPAAHTLCDRQATLRAFVRHSRAAADGARGAATAHWRGAACAASAAALCSLRQRPAGRLQQPAGSFDVQGKAAELGLLQLCCCRWCVRCCSGTLAKSRLRCQSHCPLQPTAACSWAPAAACWQPWEIWALWQGMLWICQSPWRISCRGARLHCFHFPLCCRQEHAQPGLPSLLSQAAVLFAGSIQLPLHLALAAS